MNHPTVFGIRSPWSGDESDPITWRYWVWFRAYRTIRVLRHAVRLHDWCGTPDPRQFRCSWCGKGRAA